MKFLSVKLKLTLWITSLMFFLVSVVLLSMISITSNVVTENTLDLLSSTIRQNLVSVSMQNGKLIFDENFNFTYNGVYTLIYSDSNALLAGQPHINLPENIEFENGVTKEIESIDGEYYILDFWLHFGWEDGVWVRGIVPKPDVTDIIKDIEGIALTILPLTIIIGGLGAYLLARKTFKPINKIINAASAIGEGRDLSLRIGLPKGKDEITKLASAFDNMFARLEKSFETEKQFTSDASHELRTPTAVILAECNDSINHTSIDEYKKSIEVINRQAVKMSNLIKQLLQMTRLEQGTQAVNFETQDLSEFIHIICSEQPDLPKTMSLYLDIQDNIIAEFDIVLMSRLLQNLINNAITYGNPNGFIKIRLYKELKTIFLSVEDNGIGMTKDELQNIWKRFYQADQSRQNGAGLGLTMVKQIANLHHGDIKVTSKEGKGSLFVFSFPEKQY